MLSLAVFVGCQSPMLVDSSTLLSQTLLEQSKTVPENKPAESSLEQAELLSAVAAAAETRGDHGEAIEHYEKVLKSSPDDGHAAWRLGVLYARRGLTEQSLEMFQRAVESNPEDPELRCDYAYALYLGERFDQAELQIKESVQLEPELIRARNILGMILARNGDAHGAMREFTLAKVPPAEAHANIAFAMLLNGDPVAAMKRIQLAESMQPTRKLASQLAAYRDSIHGVQARADVEMSIESE